MHSNTLLHETIRKINHLRCIKTTGKSTFDENLRVEEILRKNRIGRVGNPNNTRSKSSRNVVCRSGNFFATAVLCCVFLAYCDWRAGEATTLFRQAQRTQRVGQRNQKCNKHTRAVTHALYAKGAAFLLIFAFAFSIASLRLACLILGNFAFDCLIVKN